QTETEATGAPQKHHYTLNQQVGSITRGFLLSATQHGNKPPSRHEAKSLKRHVDYTGPVLFLTRYIHALCCLAL
ncbi:hypothetical protein RAG33_25040, partial [Klebsiella pneumoniae]